MYSQTAGQIEFTGGMDCKSTVMMHAGLLLGTGHSFRMLNMYSEVLACIEQGIAIILELDHSGADVGITHAEFERTLVFLFDALGRRAEAVGASERALSISEASKDEGAIISSLLSMVAYSIRDEAHERSLQLLHRAETICLAAPSGASRYGKKIIDIRLAKGGVLLRLGRHAEVMADRLCELEDAVRETGPNSKRAQAALFSCGTCSVGGKSTLRRWHTSVSQKQCVSGLELLALIMIAGRTCVKWAFSCSSPEKWCRR